jgi:hypothetical protein
MTEPQVQFGPCCFCAQPIAEGGPDPCSIDVTTCAGKWQTWWCHADCFKERLTNPPEAPGFFDPAHF